MKGEPKLQHNVLIVWLPFGGKSSECNKGIWGIHDICPFFLHGHNFFLAQFFSTQKCVNRDKTISTKQRKLTTKWFYDSWMQQNTLNCTHHFSTLQIFFTFLKWRAFSTWKSITWRISPHDSLCCTNSIEADQSDVTLWHEWKKWVATWWSVLVPGNIKSSCRSK